MPAEHKSQLLIAILGFAGVAVTTVSSNWDKWFPRSVPTPVVTPTPAVTTPPEPITSPEIWKGSSRTAPLGAAGPVVVTVPRGEGGKLKTHIERTDPLVAPLAKNQRVGTVKITTSTGTSVAEVPLVALEAVEPAGIFGRAWDAIHLWIK